MATTRWTDDPTLALLTLLRRHGNGARVGSWLREVGCPRAALELAARTAPEPGAAAIAAIAAAVESDRAWLDRPGRSLISILDPDFPPLLRDSPHAPAALWIEGDPTRLWAPQVAVVGARQATPSGLALARDFAATFARAGLTVTSGLAEGIDAAAHLAALDAGAPTIAVCGTGLGHVYPRRHAALAERIRDEGALVSEFPPDTGPRAAHFPRRNRIIAGLALGTLVVEAGVRSGSLVTARLATEQGREVFAIPGSIHNPLARGCHRLLRDGASLVEEAAEVLAALAPLARGLGHAIATRLGEHDARQPDRGPPDSNTDAQRVLRTLAAGPAGIDELVAMSELDAARVAAALLMLELDGRVARATGGFWMKVE